MGKEGAVLLSEPQRDLLIDRYADLLNQMMWFVMGVTLAGLLGYAAAAIALDEDPHLWVGFLVAIVATIPAFTIRPRLRRWVSEQGWVPTIPRDQVIEVQRQRLKAKSWTTILAPAIVVPFLALRLHPHWPPRDGDDFAVWLMLAALAAVLIWAILRKLRADRLTAQGDF